MKTRKLVSKTLTKEGLLLTYDDDKKTYLTLQQVSMLHMLGEVPKVGAEIATKDSTNPLTGEVSDTWVTLGLS